jgi:hypothetical protein
MHLGKGSEIRRPHGKTGFDIDDVIDIAISKDRIWQYAETLTNVHVHVVLDRIND